MPERGSGLPFASRTSVENMPDVHTVLPFGCLKLYYNFQIDLCARIIRNTQTGVVDELVLLT